MIETERLILRAFRDEDREAFAAINADPRVADWLGGVRDRAASDDLDDRINANIARLGYDFWAAERKADGVVVGMIGLRLELHDPPAPCVENGLAAGGGSPGPGTGDRGRKSRAGLGVRKPRRE